MKASSPAEQPPAQKVASPAVKPASPAQKVASPPVRPASLAPKVASPAMKPASPAQKGASPAVGPASPAQQVASAAVRPASPAQKAAASPAMKAPSSPVATAASSPAVDPSSPALKAAAAPSEPTPAPERPAGEKEKAKTSSAKAKKAKLKAKKEHAAGDLKPATASREDNLTYDLRHLAAYDIAPLPPQADLLAYTRDSVQMLINKLFSLERTHIDEGMAAELPVDELFRIPRQKPLPKEKPKTRFQQFMEDRNMRKRKRSRLVFDEASGDWKPRWGYKSGKKDEEKAKMAIYEVKKGEDPNSNPFERMQAEKKLALARQKMREVRNKVEAAGGKLRASVPDLLSNQKRGKEGLREAIKRAQVSSGSRGKFDRLAPNEATNLQAKRQKLGAPVSGEKERDRYLKFAGKVLSGETVDKDKAAKVGRQQAEGMKLGRKGKTKGMKGLPGSARRSKQGKKQGGRQKGRKVKA